jgi:hypothetical protein
MKFFLMMSAIMLLSVVACNESKKDEGAGTDTAMAASSEKSVIPWRLVETNGLNWGVRWRPLQVPIPIAEPFDLEVDLSGAPERIDGTTIIVDAEMPHHGHGMNLVPVISPVSSENGRRWMVEGMMCHMPGRWEFSVDLLKDGRMERTQWTVELD